MNWKKYWKLLLIICAVVVLVWLMIPHVSQGTAISIERIEEYPLVHDVLMESPEIVPGREFYAVEISSILGCRQVYVIPCYEAVTGDVPQNGDTHWTAAVCFQAVCGDENFALPEISVRDLTLEMDLGEETMLSSRVELNGEDLYDMGTERRVVLPGKTGLTEDGTLGIGFIAATSAKAESENQEVQGSFVWSYDLYLGGKKIGEIRNEGISGTYIVNAT